jgi:hypothetical protein
VGCVQYLKKVGSAFKFTRDGFGALFTRIAGAETKCIPEDRRGRNVNGWGILYLSSSFGLLTADTVASHCSVSAADIDPVVAASTSISHPGVLGLWLPKSA